MNNMTRTIALTIAITGVCGALPVLAQPSGAPARGFMPFAAFDQDGNGSVTEQEFNAVHGQRMAERAATGAPMRGAANAPTFADFDQNGDGQLLPDEFAAAHQSLMQNRPGRGMGAGMGPGMGRGMGRNMPTFAEFDLNRDGSLTEKEFYEARANRIKERSEQGYQMRNLSNAPVFGAIDLDGNGLVDPQEFAMAQARHRQQMMQPPMPPAPPQR
jgi:hypothetical protein